MEDPKVVTRWLVVFVAVVGLGCAGLSFYLWDASPLVLFLLALIVGLLASVAIAAILGASVWPLAVLIGKLSMGRRRHG